MAFPDGGDLVAFDLETTGLSPRSDRVIEIGAVRFDATMRMVAELELLVDPGAPIPLAIQRLTGIGGADVEGAPSPVEGMAQLADFCEGAELVAHGAAFDLTFCAGLAPQAFARRRVFDTLELARILLPTAPSHSLPLLSARLGFPHHRPHRALSDATATWRLFAHLRSRAEALPVSVLARMRVVAAVAATLPESTLPSFLSQVVRGSGDPEAAAFAGSQVAMVPPPAAPSPPVPDLPGTVAALLSSEPPAAFSGGDQPWELREAQVEMGRAVAQAVQRRQRVVVEAGTGVGKSLAYLLPLALHTAAGGRAVVATRTVTLQEQLLQREIPLVELITGAPVAAAVLKGRNQQLSLRRWHRFLHSADTGARGVALDRIRFKLKLLAWLAETRCGDRAELHLSADEQQLWRHVESDGGDCLGSACANWQSERCFMVAARRVAAQARLVITNHALLTADSESGGRSLGDFDVLVIDEAHHLEETATNQLGSNLRLADITLLIDRLNPPAGPLASALAAAGEAARRLFGDVKGRIGEILGADHSGNATVALSAETRSERGHQMLVGSACHAIDAWRLTAERLRDPGQRNAHQLDLLDQPERETEERLLAAAGFEAAAAAVERIVLRPAEGRVAWLALRAEQGELHDAPVAVAEQLRETVYTRADTVVATSATLAVSGDLGYSRTRLGLDGAEELVLPSPFDYLDQALCILPEAVPPYADPEHDAVVATLLGDVAERLGGSTLALFTGYGPLRRVHALLGPRLEATGIALLGQGLDGTRRQILHSFMDNRRTVLLGTASFWEGIDVSGDALRCVVIDKLPFAVPTDPLVRARTAELADPFGQYILPQAVLRLRQGFGRLIRHGTDRGAVVLCDERLRSREYGERIIAALPPAAVAVLPLGGVGVAVEDFVVRHQLPPLASWGVGRRQSMVAMIDEQPA